MQPLGKLLQPQLTSDGIAIGEEGPREDEGLSFFIVHLSNPLRRKIVDQALAVTEQDRRVGRDDELRSLVNEVLHPSEKYELPAG